MLYCYPYYPYTSSNPFFSYDFVQSKFKEQMDFTLRYSSSPVGLGIHSDLVSYDTFVDSMTWIDQQLATGTPIKRLAGMDIWWFVGMTQTNGTHGPIGIQKTSRNHNSLLRAFTSYDQCYTSITLFIFLIEKQIFSSMISLKSFEKSNVVCEAFCKSNSAKFG